MQSNQISTDPGNRNLYGGNLFTLCLCCLWEIWMILQKFAQICGRRDIFCAHRPQCFLIWVWTSPYWSRCELHHIGSPLPWMVQRDLRLMYHLTSRGGHSLGQVGSGHCVVQGSLFTSKQPCKAVLSSSDFKMQLKSTLCSLGRICWLQLVVPLWEECAPCGSHVACCADVWCRRCSGEWLS